MPDDPNDTQARRGPGAEPGRAGPRAPQDAADVPTTDEPSTNEPLPVAGDDPGVGMSEPPEPDIEGQRGM